MNLHMFMKTTAALALSLGLAACTNVRRTEPVAAPLQFSDPALARGEKVYAQYCHMCHPNGQGGLGPALNNKPLPAFLMKFQVRHGLGAMPSFKDDKLSSEDLDALTAYIKTLRHNTPPADNTAPRGR
jgi:mono/diheme cytochrome c family protein